MTERECNECNSDFSYSVLLPIQSPVVINKFDKQIEPLSAEKSGFLLSTEVVGKTEKNRA